MHLLLQAVLPARRSRSTQRRPRTVLGIGTVAAHLLISAAAQAEGTAQLGAGQDIRETTAIEVDILSVGEVINIHAGNNSALDPTGLRLVVTDPDGQAVAGSPFDLEPGSPGWLDTPNVVPSAADVTNPLQLVAGKVGTYQLRFDHLGTFVNAADAVIDPLDITVTPNAATAIDPAAPPGGFGRVHSLRWDLNAHSFAESSATNAAFYVLTPTGTESDFTWKLQFEGLAGYLFEVSGNDVGLPPPRSGVSEDDSLIGAPRPLYDVYLNVPEVARGGNPIPSLSGFDLDGPAPVCACAIPSLDSTLSFESDVDGVYEIIIDLDDDGSFDPSSGDVLLRGAAREGTNQVVWDGRDGSGNDAPAGSYDVRLAVRLGEFHFVGRDIETSNPGLRIFGLNPPLPSTTATPANMLWDDSRVNQTLSSQHQTSPGGAVPVAQRSSPESTLASGGLSSGDPADGATCGVNAHCWGNFESAVDPASPGNYRYIDTYVFFTEAVLTTLACVEDAAADLDGDGLGSAAECGGNVVTDPAVADTDGDGLLDGEEDLNGNGSVDAGETDPTRADSDGDQLMDGLELHGAIPTDPLSADTDNDGLPDGLEDANQNGALDPGETSPQNPDTDGDGLLDGTEDANGDGQVNPGETDPLDADSDDDGVLDGREDTNHDGSVDPGETDPLARDSDGDGLTDGQEDADGDGLRDASETDPTRADSDGDGLSDGIERGVAADGSGIAQPHLSDPLAPDTDSDGLRDGEEDLDADGVVGPGESDPTSVDSDADGSSDGLERGRNADGSPISDANLTNAADPDSDQDGLRDGVEDADQDGRFDATTETDPNRADSDGDELLDGAEDRNGNGTRDGAETDPRQADTDGGGERDGSEVDVTGHDPLDPSDDRAGYLALFGGGGSCELQPSQGSRFELLLFALALVTWRRRARRRERSSSSVRGAR